MELRSEETTIFINQDAQLAKDLIDESWPNCYDLNEFISENKKFHSFLCNGLKEVHSFNGKLIY